MSDKSKKKILVIEDNLQINRIYVSKFQFEGMEVSTASNGDEGLKKIQAEKPDLILLDIMLPGKSGFEVLKTIKENPQTKNIPVLILTNLAQAEEQKRGEKLGAEDYLVKTNTSIFQVVKKAKEILQRSNSIKQLK
jgi:DNA-binding response OmpR family regulator